MTGNLPDRHPTLGVPSKIYLYRNEQGEALAAVYRFEAEEAGQVNTALTSRTGQTGLTGQDRFIPVETGIQRGVLGGISSKTGKTIRPYCLVEEDWKRPAIPILYDLERLVLDRSEPVIIVEGEKCADALAWLRLVASTSMGGSNAAHKTDWSPLAGRDVIIWPDHDEAGRKYAETVAGLCAKAGANTIAIVKISTETINNAIDEPSSYPLGPVATGHDRSGPVDNIGVPTGWDAANALEEGWGREHVLALLAQAEPYVDRSVRQAVNDNWPEPDFSFLKTEAAPPVFPVEILPYPIADWAEKTAKSKSAPVDYVLGALLTASASLIGSSRKVSPWKGWTEPIVLWAALVGQPSMGKSPAMDPTISILAEIERDALSEHAENIRQYETDKMQAELIKSDWERRAKDAVGMGGSAPLMPEGAIAPEMPVSTRLTVRDATTEAMLSVLKGQDKGFLSIRDELAGWFASMDRYAGNKGGDRALWLEAYGGRPYTLDRVKNGGEAVHIPSLSVSVLGGIQPDRLEACLLKGDDDGLSSRFLYFCPLAVPRERPKWEADNSLLENVFRKLHSLKHDQDEAGKARSRKILLSGPAADRFSPWWQSLPDRETSNFRMNGWWGKTQGIALRIALILEYLDWAVRNDNSEPREVSLEAIENAIYFMDEYAGPMAERAHGIVSKTEADIHTIMLAHYIREQSLEAFTVRELQKDTPMRKMRAQEIKEACFNLAGYGWLQAAPVRHGETPGKPQARFLVNPAVHDA